MWDLPGPGLGPVSPALAGGFLTTAPPGKPGSWSIFKSGSFLCFHCVHIIKCTAVRLFFLLFVLLKLRSITKVGQKIEEHGLNSSFINNHSNKNHFLFELYIVIFQALSYMIVSLYKIL